ncbi:MAG: DUF2490 domain-containing protein [Flavobacteriaceae bacterium]|nr:DUF2490 domain-containing protein [Flavobacteriaceae bacterium]
MNNLLTSAEDYVLELLNNNLDKNYLYHDIAHTQRVVESSIELSEKQEVSEEEKENIVLAAWFHDTGFIENAINHERESVKIAKSWLAKQKVSNDRILVISNIILATKIDVHRENLRFRTGLDYNIRKIPLEPKVDIELFNRFNSEEDINYNKYRFTFGLSYNLKKNGKFEAYYRFENDVNTTSPNRLEVWGLQYRYSIN